MSKKLILILVFFFISVKAFPQCSMCRAVLESQASNTTAEGINDGIVYLMLFPYLLVGGVGYFIYRSRKKQQS